LNLGWIGVGLLATLIVTGYRAVMTTFRRDPGARGIRLALFVVAVIYSLTEAGFRENSLVWIFFLMVTTRVPEAASVQAPSERRPVPEEMEKEWMGRGQDWSSVELLSQSNPGRFWSVAK
jgi:hypothetical protein